MDLIKTTGLLFLGLSFTVLSAKASPWKKTPNDKGGFSITSLSKSSKLTVFESQRRPDFRASKKLANAKYSRSKQGHPLSLRTRKSDSSFVDSSFVQQIYTVTPPRTTIASSDAVYSTDILKYPITSFSNALTGRLAGLFTLQSSGTPGADNASHTLRGQTPIVVIDGVVANLSIFDLEEIESVTVLKDALATAMLGVRGAHGAILVTTKKGRAAKQQISFTAQTAVQQPISWPKTLNAFDYASLKNEALANDGIDLNSGLYYSQLQLDAYKNHSDPINYPDVNYREAITKKSSLFNKYTLSANGGSQTARYFVALEHANQSGFFRTVDSNSYNTNNTFKSYLIRSNVDINITNKISGGIYLLGRILNSNEPGADTEGILSNLLNTPANAYPILNQNNSFSGSQLYQNNLLAQTIGSGYRQRFSRDILVNIYLQRNLSDVLKGLWIKAKAAYNSTLAEDINRSKSFAVYQQTANGYLQFGTKGEQQNTNGIAYQGRTDYQELSLGYDNTFNKHGLNLLLLANRDNSIDATNALLLPYTIVGTSGRVAYNYDKKYLIEASFGLNGSNRYPNEGATKYGFFPAVGLGWNIERENFMQSMPFINRLKLYTSYGTNGWDNAGYFSYYQRYVDGFSPYFGTGPGTVTSITEGTLANRNITFEKANKFNLGLDGSVLNNRLAFKTEYFNNKYYDLVMQRGSNSSLLGNSYPNENIGKNRYFGWEGQLSWQDKVKDLQYFIAVNCNSVGSKVVYMDEVSRPYSWMQRTGEPVGQRFGYAAEGLFQNQQEINNSATIVGYTPQPGDIKYSDLNKDGVIDQNDITAIGTTKPLFFYKISFGLSWKGFDISALLQGVENRNVYLSGPSYWAFQNNGSGQAYSHNLDRWTPENATNATYPRLSYGSNLNNDASSSFWVRSGDYFRLKNAEIGYSLPVSLIRKARLNSVRIFANGYNLLTHASSGLNGRDPESFTGGYPIQRLFNFGANVKF